MTLYHVYVRTRRGWKELPLPGMQRRDDATGLARDYARAMRISGTQAQIRVATNVPRDAR